MVRSPLWSSLASRVVANVFILIQQCLRRVETLINPSSRGVARRAHAMTSFRQLIAHVENTRLTRQERKRTQVHAITWSQGEAPR